MSNNKRLLLYFICGAQFLEAMNISIVNVALPTIQDYFGMSSVQLQWIITAYVLTFAGFLLFGGRASDLFGRKKVFLWGVSIFTIGSLLNGIAVEPLLLIVGRAVQGVGAAISIPAAMSMISTSFDEGAERNKALALFGSMGAIGFAFGLIGGGVITELVGWRYIFLVNVPFAIMILVGISKIVQENQRMSKKVHVDYIGTIVGTIGLIILVLGVTRGEAVGWASLSSTGLLVLGLVILFVFVGIERKMKHPIMPLRLFKSRALTVSNIAGFLQYSTFMGIVFFSTLYLQEVLEYSAMFTGFAFLPMSIGAVFAAKFTPKMMEYTSVKIVYCTALLILAGSLFWMSTMSLQSSYTTFILPIFFLIGIGLNMGYTAAVVGAIQDISEEDHGAAGGIVNTFFQVGAGVGLSILVTIANSIIGHSANPSKILLMTGYSQALVTGSIFALVAALIVALFLQTKPKLRVN